MSNHDDNGAWSSGSTGGGMIHQGGDFLPSKVVMDQGFYPPAEMLVGRDGTPIRSYLEIVLRHKWLVLSVMTLIAGTAIPLIWVTVVPEYRASSVIRVSPVVPRMIYQYEENGMVPLYTGFLNTQVSMIAGPKVLQRVLDLPAVQELSWYKEQERSLFGGPVPPIQRLDKCLSVRSRGMTELIDVSVTVKSPEVAKTIVDAVVEQYLDLVQKSDKETETNRLETLKEQATKLRAEIEQYVQQRNIISMRLGTGNPEDFRAHITTVLSTLQEQYEATARERQLNEARLTRLVPPENVDDGEMGPAVAEDPETIRLTVRYGEDAEWRRLKDLRDDTKHSLAQLREQYGEGNPKIKQTVADIGHFERKMAARESELDEPGAKPMQTTAGTETTMPPTFNPGFLKNMIADAIEQERLLLEAVEKQRQKVREAGQLAQDLADVDQKLEAKRLEADTIRERTNVLQVESKAPGRVSIASTAMLPFEAYRDRRILLTIMALIASIAMGLAAAFVRVFLDPSIRQAGDLATTVQMPFLGYLPKVRAESELWEDVSDEMLESMRMIRTALLDRLPVGEPASVLITSSGARAGKTSVAMLLARSLSHIGKRVLLVDADLRRPSLTKRLDVKAEAGLSELLKGNATQEQAIVRTKLPGVDVIATIECDGSPNTELIANGAFGTNLRLWKSMYDFVLLDSPPVLPVADARIMAGQVDGAILTLRASHCRKSDALDAAALLATSGCRPLGTILVGVDKASSYGGRYAGVYAYAASRT